MTDIDPVGPPGPVSERVRQWSDTWYEVQPFVSKQTWKGIRGRVSQHVPARQRKRRRGRRRASTQRRNLATDTQSEERVENEVLHAEAVRVQPPEEGARSDEKEIGSRLQAERTAARRATYRSVPITTTVSRTAWTDSLWDEGAASVRWVVTQAIRKGTGSTGLRLGPAYLRWMRHGERLPRSAEPVDYASLLLLSRDGSEFVSTVGLLGLIAYNQETAATTTTTAVMPRTQYHRVW